METIIISSLVVALAEFGDKTQLFAIIMTIRYRKPLPILAAILSATIFNHLVAAAGGYFLANFFDGVWFRLGVALLFIAMAVWTLVPDQTRTDTPMSGRGAFLATLAGIFILEMGDKTQIATAMLAAKYHSVILVAVGTTFGMLVADAIAITFADRASRILPIGTIRAVGAGIFMVLGVLGLVDLAAK